MAAEAQRAGQASGDGAGGGGTDTGWGGGETAAVRPSSGGRAMGHGTQQDFCRINEGNLLLSYRPGARNS